MKPIQQHKDSGIANISLDHFTGTICIITDEDLMLSSPQTNPNDIFNPNHKLTLITQPVLGARSRKKHHIDSITSTRRTSYNHSPSLILPINQEKKTNHYESTDSGIDLSLSTNSSVQYPQQQHVTIHRPLSALSEDSGTDEQSIRIPVVNLGRNRSLENILNINTNEQQKNRSSSLSDEREKFVKRSNDSNHLDTITEVYHQTNANKTEYVQQHRLLNDLPIPHTIIRRPNIATLKPLTKRTKLKIIIQPSLHTDTHDEQIHSSTRTTSGSSNQTTTHLIKPKAITPLGHYPNQEQIRAHINRSVIERQHPSYLSIPTRKGLVQHKLPFDVSPSKVNHLLIKHPKQSTNPSHISPSRQTLPNLYNNENHRQEKQTQKRLSHENPNKEHFRIKEQSINQHNFTPRQQEENFLTSTPRHDNDHRQKIKHSSPNSTDKKSKQNLNRRQQPTDPKPSKNRTIHPNNEFELKYSPRYTIVPLQTRSTKIIHISPEQKSPIESINNLLQTTRIQPNNNQKEINRFNNISTQKPPNRYFQTRSPISWAVRPDQQLNNIYETSSSSSSPNLELMDDKLTHNYQFMINNDQQQQPIDGRFVIPSDNSQLPLLIDSPSQTSSRHTYPFTYTPDSETNENAIITNSPRELIVPNNSEMMFNHQSTSSSPLDQFCPNERFPLPLGKGTIAKEQDDISTNYDSDDGWSNDSAELIYIDERYAKQKKKKKTTNSSSSHVISKQHAHIKNQRKNVLLQ